MNHDLDLKYRMQYFNISVGDSPTKVTTLRTDAIIAQIQHFKKVLNFDQEHEKSQVLYSIKVNPLFVRSTWYHCNICRYMNSLRSFILVSLFH